MLPNLGKAKVKTNIRGWRVEVREIKGAKLIIPYIG